MGISGSRAADNCIGYPNQILSSGTRTIALWDDVVCINIYINIFQFKLGKCVEQYEF